MPVLEIALSGVALGPVWFRPTAAIFVSGRATIATLLKSIDGLCLDTGG